MTFHLKYILGLVALLGCAENEHTEAPVVLADSIDPDTCQVPYAPARIHTAASEDTGETSWQFTYDDSGYLVSLARLVDHGPTVYAFIWEENVLVSSEVSWGDGRNTVVSYQYGDNGLPIQSHHHTVNDETGETAISTQKFDYEHKWLQTAHSYSCDGDTCEDRPVTMETFRFNDDGLVAFRSFDYVNLLNYVSNSFEYDEGGHLQLVDRIINAEYTEPSFGLEFIYDSGRVTRRVEYAYALAAEDQIQSETTYIYEDERLSRTITTPGDIETTYEWTDTADACALRRAWNLVFLVDGFGMTLQLFMATHFGHGAPIHGFL